MSRMLRMFATGLMVLALPSASIAQDAGDWELVENPQQKSLLAVTAFDNGLALLVGCVDGRYEAIITGLPPIAARERNLRFTFRDSRESDQKWFVAQDSRAALAPLPAPLAREVRLGGQIQITVPRGAPDGRRDLRYVVELPHSASAIDQTLTRCGRPLTDPRDTELLHLPDTGLPVELEWVRRPDVSYPRTTRYAYGWTVVSCLTQANGQLHQCEVETEQPANSGFADAALRGMGVARVRHPDGPDALLAGRLIHFRLNFVVEGFEEGAERPPPTGSRIPPRRR